MSKQHIQSIVYLVPAGEQESQCAFRQFAVLCRIQSDLLISVYHELNPNDGLWYIILIGQPAWFIAYEQPIQTILQTYDAQRIDVPMERLNPIRQRFLRAQTHFLQ